MVGQFRSGQDAVEVIGVAARRTTAAYLLHLDEAWTGGPELIVAFGMGGPETLVFAYLLRTRAALRALLDMPRFAMVEPVGELPKRPCVDLSFADGWAAIEKILKHLGLPADLPSPAPPRAPPWLPDELAQDRSADREWSD